MTLINDILCKQYEFEKDIDINNVTNETLTKIKEYFLKKSGYDSIPDFKPGLQWFNTEHPLSLREELRGSVVVLDFFTYCCVNCLHVLPDLGVLEQEIPPSRGLVVVGVHSAKFDGERSGVGSAVERLLISHPVVNDVQATLWTELGVTCWPTLLGIGPQGQPLFVLQGEGHRDRLLLYCRAAVQLPHLSPVPLPLNPSFTAPLASSLRFPAKMAMCQGRLALTDLHRVLVLNLAGSILQEFGSTEAGFEDGSTPRFNSPQGVAWLTPTCLLLADTGNDALREIDLATGLVSTVARILNSSPWDICVVKSDDIESDEPGDCYVAMAGCHQIWIYRPRRRMENNGSTSKDAAVHLSLFAGSGAEENRNNLYPDKAGFAQPSGLALCWPHGCLVVADSESSSVRTVDLQTGAVKSLVGGALDPLDLFGFGDSDGKGRSAKLQHPLGVACDGDEVYISDSYNHKIRKVNMADKNCTTLWKDGLSEPNGLCLWENRLYIADTNHHAIKVLDLRTLNLEELEIKLEPQNQVDSDPVTKLPEVTIAPGGLLSLRLVFREVKKLSTVAPHHLSVSCGETQIKKRFAPQDLPLVVELAPKSPSIRATCRLYICERDLCTSENFSFLVPLKFSSSVPLDKMIVVDLPAESQ